MAKIGVIGSGDVAKSLGKGLVKLGNEVMMGTRNPEKLAEWHKEVNKASIGSFEDAASFGDMIFLCCKGTEIDSAIDLAGIEHFSSKVLVDVTNPLIIQNNEPIPRLAIGFPDSNGLHLQLLLPKAKVIKAFNMVPSAYMANAKLQEGNPDLFIAGNDAVAKKQVMDIASAWGWQVTDIGHIDQSYLLEALAMLWIRYAFLHNQWTHAFKLLKK